MTPDTAYWILGAVAVPAIGWAIHMTFMLMKTKAEVTILLKMHRGTNKNLEENTRAIRSLTHYFRWFITETLEKDPPPPLEGGATVVGGD